MPSAAINSAPWWLSRLAGGFVDEIGTDAARYLRPALSDGGMWPRQAVRSRHRADLLQRAAVDRELAIYSRPRCRAFAPDRLASWKRTPAPGAHARCIELVEQAEFDQFAHGVRQPLMRRRALNAGTLFEDFGRNADLVQAERQCHPPMPPPAMRTVMIAPRLWMASWHGGARGNCEGARSRQAAPFRAVKPARFPDKVRSQIEPDRTAPGG